MGQPEVFQWLLERRENGDANYYDATQVRLGLLDKGIVERNVSMKLMLLADFGYLDAAAKRFKPVMFRAKDKYIRKGGKK